MVAVRVCEFSAIQSPMVAVVGRLEQAEECNEEQERAQAVVLKSSAARGGGKVPRDGRRKPHYRLAGNAGAPVGCTEVERSIGRGSLHLLSARRWRQRGQKPAKADREPDLSSVKAARQPLQVPEML